MKIRPLHDRVVVERQAEEELTKGGIFIPDTAKEKPTRATVIAVGPGKKDDGKLHALEVKIGDVVLIGKYAGTEVTLGEKAYVVLREDDIMGVVEG